MNKITNYPNQDDYETEEEFNEAQELYWMELDRQYDEFKQDKLEEEIYLARLELNMEEQNVSEYNTGKVLLVRRIIKHSNTRKNVKQRRRLSRVRDELRPLQQV